MDTGSRRYVLQLSALWMILQKRSGWILWSSERKILIKGYYEDAYLKPIAANTNGIFECLEKGADYIHWEEKRKEYTNQTGNIRRGVGMSLFSYKTGVWPISLEIAGARMTLNQDGSVA